MDDETLLLGLGIGVVIWLMVRGDAQAAGAAGAQSFLEFGSPVQGGWNPQSDQNYAPVNYG